MATVLGVATASVLGVFAGIMLTHGPTNPPVPTQTPAAVVQQLASPDPSTPDPTTTTEQPPVTTTPDPTTTTTSEPPAATTTTGVVLPPVSHDGNPPAGAPPAVTAEPGNPSPVIVPDGPIVGN